MFRSTSKAPNQRKRIGGHNKTYKQSTITPTSTPTTTLNKTLTTTSHNNSRSHKTRLRSPSAISTNPLAIKSSSIRSNNNNNNNNPTSTSTKSLATTINSASWTPDRIQNTQETVTQQQIDSMTDPSRFKFDRSIHYHPSIPSPATTVRKGKLKNKPLGACSDLDWRVLFGRGALRRIPTLSPTLFAMGMSNYGASFDYSSIDTAQIDPELWQDYEILADYSAIPPHFGIGGYLQNNGQIRAIEVRKHMRSVIQKMYEMNNAVVNSMQRNTTTIQERQRIINACSSMDNILALTSIGQYHFEPIIPWTEERFDTLRKEVIRQELEKSQSELYDSMTFEPLSKLHKRPDTTITRISPDSEDDAKQGKSKDHKTVNEKPKNKKEAALQDSIYYKHTLKDTLISSAITQNPSIRMKKTAKPLIGKPYTEAKEELAIVDSVIKHNLQDTSVFNFHPVVLRSDYFKFLSQKIKALYKRRNNQKRGKKSKKKVGVEEEAPEEKKDIDEEFPNPYPDDPTVQVTSPLNKPLVLPNYLDENLSKLSAARMDLFSRRLTIPNLAQGTETLLYFHVPPTSPFVLMEPKSRFDEELKLGVQELDLNDNEDDDEIDPIVQGDILTKKKKIKFDKFLHEVIAPEISSRVVSPNRAADDFDFSAAIVRRIALGEDDDGNNEMTTEVEQPKKRTKKKAIEVPTLPPPPSLLDPSLYYHTPQTTTNIVSPSWTNDPNILTHPSSIQLVATQCLKECVQQYFKKLNKDFLNDFPPSYPKSMVSNSALAPILESRESIQRDAALMSDTLTAPEKLFNVTHPPFYQHQYESMQPRKLKNTTVQDDTVHHLANYSEPPDVLPAQFVFLSFVVTGPKTTASWTSKRSISDTIIQVAAVDGLGNEFQSFVQPSFPVEELPSNQLIGVAQRAWNPQSPSLGVALDALMQWIYHPLSGRIPTTFKPNPSYSNPVERLPRRPLIRAVVKLQHITDFELEALPPTVQRLFLQRLKDKKAISRCQYDFLTQVLTVDGLEIIIKEKSSIPFQAVSCDDPNTKASPLSTAGQPQARLYLSLTEDQMNNIHDKYKNNPTIVTQRPIDGPRELLNLEVPPRPLASQPKNNGDKTRSVYGGSIEAEIVQDSNDENQNTEDAKLISHQFAHLISGLSHYTTNPSFLSQGDNPIPSPLPPTMIICQQPATSVRILDRAIREINYNDAQSNLSKPYTPLYIHNLTPDQRFDQVMTTHQDFDPKNSYRRGFFGSGLHFYDPTRSVKAFFPQEVSRGMTIADIAYWTLDGSFQNGITSDALYLAHRARSFFFMEGVPGAFMRSELHRAYEMAVQSGTHYLNNDITYPVSTFHNIYRHQKAEFEKDNGDESTLTTPLFQFGDYGALDALTPDQLDHITGNKKKGSKSEEDIEFILKQAFPSINFQPGNVVWDFAKNNYRKQLPGEAGHLEDKPDEDYYGDDRDEEGKKHLLLPNIRGVPLSTSMWYTRQLTPTMFNALGDQNEVTEDTKANNSHPLNATSTSNSLSNGVQFTNVELIDRWKEIATQSRVGIISGGGAGFHEGRGFDSPNTPRQNTPINQQNGSENDSNGDDDSDDYFEETENELAFNFDGNDGKKKSSKQQTQEVVEKVSSKDMQVSDDINNNKEDDSEEDLPLVTNNYKTKLSTHSTRKHLTKTHHIETPDYPHLIDENWSLSPAQNTNNNNPANRKNIFYDQAIGKPFGEDERDAVIFYHAQSSWLHTPPPLLTEGGFPLSASAIRGLRVYGKSDASSKTRK